MITTTSRHYDCIARLPTGAPPFPTAPFSHRRKRRRGQSADFSGRAAEETAARLYQRSGYRLLEERWRCEAGEIDLICERDGALVFVEVKYRKKFSAWDSPVTAHQWRRLEAAASQYTMLYQADTGVHPFCRFDVALIDGRGAVQIIENAWSCLM